MWRIHIVIMLISLKYNKSINMTQVTNSHYAHATL
ncbi:hypothetical protein THZG08_230054 [Vibrio owensii]|nr:hypothetical protein THZG08_230054 [Vibrio owensii]CAH1561644.1 hypothetical protein THOA03_230054 [Vibrio owensii]